MKLDYFLISVVAILILLGIIILTSVSATLGQEKFGSPIFFLLRHVGFGLLPGILLGWLAFKTPLSYFRKWAPFLLLATLLLMVLVFVPVVGISLGGASRWINLGFISLQPSEFLKLSSILYLAAWLASRTQKVKRDKEFSSTFIAFCVVMGLVSLLLVLQPDISTLGIILACGGLMYFLAGTPLKHSFFTILAGVAGLAVLIKMAPYRFNRLLAFLKPDIDPMGISYQIKQALIAVGSGGILGTGLGTSALKLSFLPQSMSDSIFAVFCEEAGFIGALVLIFPFLIFVWRGYSISKKIQDKFSQLACLGITSWIVLQAFINIGSMVGLLPLTGIPLPFVSYGGSALVAELIGVGILLNIAKNA